MVVELALHRKKPIPESSTLVFDPTTTALVVTFGNHPYQIDVRNEIKIVVAVQEVIFFIAHDSNELYSFLERQSTSDRDPNNVDKSMCFR